MKTETIGADRYLVSDAIAHHLRSYHYLLSTLARKSDVTFPVRVSGVGLSTMTVSLSRDTPPPFVADHFGVLTALDDPDGLTALIEQDALTMLHDLGEIYETIAADWQRNSELEES